MKTIPLTQGLHAIVDDDDFEWLKTFRWMAIKGRKTYYAVASFKLEGRRNKTVSMHRLVLAPNPGLEADHRDGNGLNNQKSNLREATIKQQAMNRSVTALNASGFKGVSFNAQRGKWLAQIGNARTGGACHLGLFDDPRIAAAVYDAAAVERYGEFARTNKMLGLI